MQSASVCVAKRAVSPLSASVNNTSFWFNALSWAIAFLHDVADDGHWKQDDDEVSDEE